MAESRSALASLAACASAPTASMQRSGPRPSVISMRCSWTGTSISSKLIVSALLFSRAMRSRSGSRSMAMTRPAPSIHALWIANWPTGPQPQTATVSPPSIWAFSAAM